MRRFGIRFFLFCFLFLTLLFGAGFFAIYQLAHRYSRFDSKTVANLKAPLSPDQQRDLLVLTHPILGPSPKAPKRRVLILGMDGLDFQYLAPLLQEGKLPNFKRVMEEGASATLLSMIPPNSGGAWPTLVTGCNPGKTHLLNFRRYDPSSRKIVLTDARDLRRPALWDILGFYGKKSVVINEPMSYPPHKIQGVMVSGLLAPEGKIYTYPEALSVLLNAIGYKREAVPKGEGFFAPHSILLKDTLLTERKRLELARLLMGKTDWDLFFCMFPSVDRMMHHIGRHFTREDLNTVLLEMDRVLGGFLEVLPKGTTLLLVSDHGFDFYPMQFSVPRWLEEEGYWILPEGDKPKETPLFQFLQALKRLKEKTALPDIPGIKWPQSLQRGGLLPPVDWEKSRAISVEVGGNWGSIWILKKDKKEALTKEMTERLFRLVQPGTKKKLVKRVIRGEDLFTGSYQEAMPDLLFELSGARADFAFHEQVLREDPTYHHRREGVLLAFGEGIREKAHLPPSDIVDIAPTVLYLLGLPIAKELDGSVIEPLLEPSRLALKPPQRIPHYATKPVEWVGALDEEEELPEDVQETLRSLGYLQ